MTKLVIYKITHIASGRAYIGLTRQGAAVRLRHHWKASKRESSALHRAMVKYGKGAFSWEVLATAENAADLPALEIKLIAEHKTYIRDGGFNMTRGGEGSPDICDEVRENMRAAAKRRMENPETRAKISQTLKGKKISVERAAALNAARVRAGISAEHRAKISALNKQRPPLTDEARRKISERTSTGVKAWWDRRKLDPERAAKIGSALRGKKRPPEARAAAAAGLARPEVRAKMSKNSRWRKKDVPA